MRILLIMILIAAVFAFIGWVRLDRSGDEPAVRIETRKIQQDTDTLIEEGTKAAEEAGKAIEGAVRGIRDDAAETAEEVDESADVDIDVDRIEDADDELDEVPASPTQPVREPLETP